MSKNNQQQDVSNKKHLVLEALLERCQKRNNLIFDNDLVKEICREYYFGNPFDVTKLDSKDKLPLSFLTKDICLLYSGKGRHRFVHGVDKLYHTFGHIQDTIEQMY